MPEESAEIIADALTACPTCVQADFPTPDYRSDAMGCARTQAQYVVDLTKEVPISASQLGFPGIFAGSGMKPVPLSISVTLQELVSKVADGERRITAQVLLRNTGTSVLEVPVSTDSEGILTHSNSGKRELRIELAVFSVELRKTFHFSLRDTVGSASVVGSLFALEPGQSMTVRTVGEISGSVDGTEPVVTIGSADVFAVVSEDFYDDHDYVIKSSTRRVVSANSIRVYWPVQIQRIGVPGEVK